MGMFHDFGMINVVLVLLQRNQFNRHLEVVKTYKYQIDGSTKMCSTKTTIEILENTNNSSQITITMANHKN